ncbi:MAG: hypothetical protein ACT4OT_06430 [Acidobacteriota bacterium]
MSRVLSCAFLLLIICGAVTAQQPPASAPWNVTLQTNTVADSTLTVVNRCKKNHQFQIQTQNVPFLQLSANQVNVKGGQTQVVAVKFDTRNTPPGVYQRTVLVACLTCKSEGTCTQDREVLQVILTVTAAPLGPGQPPPPSNAPSPSTTTSPPTRPKSPTVGDQNLSLDLESLRKAEAEAQAAADKARQAFETAEQDARNAQAQANAARKAVADAVKDVNDATNAVAEAEKERDRANREGTTAEREAARAALKKAEDDLAAKQKALRDAQAAAAGNSQRAADEAAKKAAEKKAEADRAEAALAAAQAAAAEKEKEILKATPPVAGTTTRIDPPPPTPCKNGAIRKLKKEKKEFVYADDDSVVEFSSTTTSAKGKSSALSMAALWRAGAAVGGVVTGGLATKRGSANAIGFVFDYLNKGADILEKLADSPLSGLNAGVSAKLAVTTKKVTVTCTTFEVCENGVWVPKATLEKVEGSGPIYKASKRAHLGDAERKNVADSSRPQYLDPDKVDKWLRDFLEGELNKLKQAKADYENFVKNCK